MNHSSSYFLIGGSGFLGHAFSDYLKKQNIQARNILRGEISDSRSLHFKEGSLDSLPISDSKNIIVDFAYTSVPNTSFSDPVKDFTENLYNINCHLAFASKLPNTTYIYISSGGTVYGNVADHEPIKENADNFPLSPYGITKLASEKYVLMHREIYGLDVKIVRPSNIFGPGQKPYRGQGFVSTALAKVFQKEPIQIFGDGNIIRDYLYVEDFCSAIDRIINYGTSGAIYNLGSGEGLTINTILDYIGNLRINPIQVEYLPDRPFDVKYNVLNSEKVEALNWKKEASIESGLQKTSQWMRQFINLGFKEA